jgi:DNA-binding CsgD family transcriptional regulator
LALPNSPSVKTSILGITLKSPVSHCCRKSSNSKESKLSTDSPKAILPLRIQQADQQLTIRLIIEKAKDRYILLLEEQATSILDALELLGLSQRETEVLSWIMQGKDNQVIATQLGIGISTVRKHLESIYRQWGINSRTEAISITLQKLGIINSH